VRGLALRVYHRLPAPARSIAATLEGYYLRWWRYGPMTERLREEAIEREHWSAEQWRNWREARLAYVLERAATRVPYYRDQWSARRRHGDRASWALLENWPILEKETVRQTPRAFVADDCSVRRMFHLRTSGTTGTPLEMWRTHDAVRGLYGIGLARTRGWHGVGLADRRAMLGGQLVTPVRQRRPPFWVWNAGLRQLYMSSYHLAPDLIPSYLDALVRHRVVYLVGYASSLHALAQAALRAGRRDLRMVVALTSAERLDDDQRRAITEAFQCPVRETYGMAENVAAATECPSGRLHLWPEVGHIEVLDGGTPVPTGGFGEFVCTGLLNADMPLIRYRLADCGRFAPPSERCACGRTLPLISGIEGRTTDLLLTRDGRRVFWLNPVLYGLPVRQAQFVQETLDRIVVRYVADPGFNAESEGTIIQRLRERMGDVQVELAEVAEIPRTMGQKLRSVICNVSPAERDAVLQQQRERASV
jgi:phenylacetate-CoA ligase